MKATGEGPECRSCKGRASRGVRTKSVALGSDFARYLTYVWVCEVCGREWLDDSLERQNEWAAEAAMLTAESPISRTINRRTPA